MSQTKTVLISNDDGVFAPGIRALAKVCVQLGVHTYVVAPARDRSSQSQAVTVTRPLRVSYPPTWDGVAAVVEVDGKPADCVKFALNQILPQRPDLVLSGINRGGNLGDDTLYSGTLGAALEAALDELPAMALSAHSLVSWSLAPEVFSDAAARARPLIEAALAAWPMPPRTCLNVNIPTDVPPHGTRSCSLARRIRTESYRAGIDPHGGAYYWLDFGQHRFAAEAGSDFELLRQGVITLTPMQPSLYAPQARQAVDHWLGQQLGGASPAPLPASQGAGDLFS